MKYFFTADLHLGHANIINYCNRPFKNVYHMNATLIKNWNAKVGNDDVVFINGDFLFKNSKGGKKGEGMQKKFPYYDKKLKGKKVYILGNHCRNNGVKSIIDHLVIKHGHHYINIVHDPRYYDPNYKINIVAHIHNKWKFNSVLDPMNDRQIDLINVGVDVWNFAPVTFEDIYREYKHWIKSKNK